MVFPFLAPATAWHMMHVKADAMGMTQWVAPFLNWLRTATIDPLQGIVALTRVDLSDAMLAQKQGISMSLVPPLHPSASPDPKYTTAAALPAASAGPAASPHEAGSDANRAVESRNMEPPPSLQHQHGGAASVDLEKNRATK